MNTEKAKKHFNNAYALCPWHVSPHVQEWLIKQMEEYHQTQLKLLGIANVVGQSEQLCEHEPLHSATETVDYCPKCGLYQPSK